MVLRCDVKPDLRLLVRPVASVLSGEVVHGIKTRLCVGVQRGIASLVLAGLEKARRRE